MNGVIQGWTALEYEEGRKDITAMIKGCTKLASI